MSEECGRAFDSIFAPLKESQERLLDYRGEGNEYGKTEFYDRFQISSKNGEYKNIQLQINYDRQ